MVSFSAVSRQLVRGSWLVVTGLLFSGWLNSGILCSDLVAKKTFSGVWPMSVGRLANPFVRKLFWQLNLINSHTNSRRTFRRWLLFLCCLHVMVSLLQQVFYWRQLPERVATHFGAGGEPNDWMDRTSAVLVIGGFQLFFPLLLRLPCLADNSANTEQQTNLLQECKESHTHHRQIGQDLKM